MIRKVIILLLGIVAIIATIPVYAADVKYTVAEQRNRAVDAYMVRKCDLLTIPEERLYCQILMHKQITWCDRIKNTKLKSNCILDVKNLRGES